MASKGTVSFQDYEKFYSDSSIVFPAIHSQKNLLRELIRESQAYILKYFRMLSIFDYQVCKMYYVDGMCQEQIAKAHDITQAAISRRLSFAFQKIKFLIKMPTLSPVQVREDFLVLFPEDLFETAFFFYWENIQNRVKNFLDFSQSGCSVRFKQIVQYCYKMKNLTDAQVAGDPLLERRRILAMSYYDYFDQARDLSNIVSFTFKRNDKCRINNVYRGKSVLERVRSKKR